jgi:thiosulfate dehydrogenase [quinone] large subunit
MHTVYNSQEFSYLSFPQSTIERIMNNTGIPLLILRLALAGLFLTLGINKISQGWLTDPEPLIKSLNNLHERAAGPQLGYLENIAIPLAPAWSKMIALGETVLGISLLLGLLVRLSSLLGVFMVLNLHAATGSLFSLGFFGTPYAGLIVAALLVMYLASGGRSFGLDAILAKRSTRGLLW